MVQQISALIIQPAVDATKYTAGANDKVAADRAMAASSREAGAAAVDTSAKINQSGDILARLSRQYVEGYASQQRFNQGLNQLSRGLEAGKINLEGAERILVGMNQRLGLTADAAQLAARGQNELAAAVTRANAQIAKQAVEAEATSRRLLAANSNVVSHGARQAAGFNAGQQLQDIAMMSFLGQSSGTIALQQGPQLATAIQQGGGLTALGAGLASLLSVTTLLTVGFTAATAATIQWFMKGKDGAKSFNEALKAHSDALALLKDQYGALGEAAKTAGNAGGIAFTDASARNAQALIEAQLRTKAGPFLATMSGTDGLLSRLFWRGGGIAGLNNLSGDQRQFAAPVAALIEEVRKGNSQGGLQKFRSDVEALYSTLVGKSNAPTALRATADAVELLGQSAFEVSGKFAPFADAINKLKVAGPEGLSTFNSEVEKIGRAKGIQTIADEAIVAGKEVVDLAEKAKELEKVIDRIGAGKRGPLIGSIAEDERNDYLGAQRSSLYWSRRAFDADMAALGAKSPQELAAAARSREAARDVDGESAEVRNQRIDLAGKRALLEAEHSLTEARQQRTRAIASSLDQQRLELDLIGKTGSEQTKLRFEFERMQELREQAARTGEPIDEKEVANIKAAAEAMGQYADALVRAKLNDDLQFEREQLFRTPGEQNIAARLRGTGLGLNSSEAQKMRQNQEFEDWKGIARGFLDDFQGELLDSGGDIGKALGRAVLGGVNSILDKIIDRLFDSIANSIASAVTGVTSGGASPFGTADGFAKMLFGAGVKSVANDNNPALANVGSTIDFGKALAGHASSIASNAPYTVANATALIRSYAPTIGMDPDIALRVAKSEGLGAGIWQSNAMRNGIREPSYGPFQLLKGGAGTGYPTGLGNAFQRQTGLDPADPANWQQATMFGMNSAAKNGWGAWYGAKAAGITGFDGIDKSAKTASTALDKFATGSTKAITGVSQLGQAGNQATQGLNTFASNLSKFPAAPSGGGGGNLLGGLLGGGLNSAFSGTAAFSWLSANPGGYIGLFDSGGSILNGNVVPFGPKTRSLGRGVLADSGFGPGHFPAILEEAESVLSRDMMGRTMKALRGTANQNADGDYGGSRGMPTRGARDLNVVINPVVNNQSSQVAADISTRRNANGSIDIVTTIKDVVADSAVTRGSPVNNALREGFGARQQLRKVS